MAFVTIFTPPDPITFSNTGWQVGGGRFQCPSSTLTAAPGKTLVRVTIKTAATTSAGNIDDCWIGTKGTVTDRWAFDGNQVQLKFSGAANVTGITGAQTFVTDATPFTYDPTKTLIVAMHMSGTQLDLVADDNTLDTTCLFDFYVSGTSTSSQTDPAMSNHSNCNVGLALIEMGDPPSVSYEADLNISSVTANSFRDLFIPPLNLSLYAPPIAPTPFFGVASPAPFNPQTYRDSYFEANAFLPEIIQGAIQSYLGAPFDNKSYHDSFFDGTAILPNVVQCGVQSTLGAPFNPQNYRDTFFDGSAILPNIVQCQVQSTLGAPFDSKNYNNLFFDGSAFLPNIIQGEIQSNLGAPFNPQNYRDTENVRTLNAFLPSIVQGQVISYLGSPFNGGAYRDTANYDNAFLPKTIQSKVASYLGGPFNSGAYHDSFLDWAAFLPSTIQGEISSNLGAPFDPKSYRDLSFFDPNASSMLPNIIQGEVQSNLGAPFNILSYRDSFVAPLNVALYPPAVIQNPFVLPLPAIPFNTLNYRDPSLPPTNPNLYPPAVIAPFVALSALPVPFNPQSYRDSQFTANAFLPNTIQGEVGSYLGGPFNPQAYRDTFFDGSAFLPNTIQGEVSAYFGAPFNSGSYRDTFFDGTGILPNIVQGEVSSTLGAPFNPLAYRDSYFDANAFLPTVPTAVQAPFFNVSPAPFDSKAYRDLWIQGHNPNLYPAPFGTPFLSLIDQNKAPFRALSYFDTYVFQRLPELFPSPTGQPFFNPYPVVPFDTKRYTDTSADLKNAFLPSIIQGQVQAYFGSPFNAGYYRDTVGSKNAFLPNKIQGQVQAYFGAPFRSGSYLDLEGVRGAFLPTVPVAATPFFNTNVSLFNQQSYRDTFFDGSAFLPNVIQGKVQAYLGSPFNSQSYRDSFFDGSAFLPNIVQGEVQANLGAPFNPQSYRDTSKYPPNPFLPRATQPTVASTLGAPFSSLSYRDSFLAGSSNTTFYPPLTAFPFFNPWLTVPFDAHTYQEELHNPRAEVNIVQLCVGQDQTIRIALQDAFGNWLQPPFDIGWFDVTLNNVAVFERNTTGQQARFISFVPGQWYFEVNIYKTDTRHIPIGWYTYNSFLGDIPLEGGLLQMMDCDVPTKALRNYPFGPIPSPVVDPFFNPIPNVPFNPMRYIDTFAGFNFFA